METLYDGKDDIGISKLDWVTVVEKTPAPKLEPFRRSMKQMIKKLFATLGYRVQGTRYCPRHLLEPRYLRTIELADVIYRRMFEFGRELTFIQTGAFDGITQDPLYPYISKHGWRGVLVEPQPREVEKLRDLYRGNQRITILQAAIDCDRGKRTLFTVESSNIPIWAHGMASFGSPQLFIGRL